MMEVQGPLNRYVTRPILAYQSNQNIPHPPKSALEKQFTQLKNLWGQKRGVIIRTECLFVSFARYNTGTHTVYVCSETP